MESAGGCRGFFGLCGMRVVVVVVLVLALQLEGGHGAVVELAEIGGVVHVGALAQAEDGDHDGQAHGGFRRPSGCGDRTEREPPGCLGRI